MDAGQDGTDFALYLLRHAHAGHGVGMQCRIEVGAMLQQAGMDDQRAALDGLDVGVGQHVAGEIDL